MREAVTRFLTTRVKWWNLWATVVVSLAILWIVPEAFWKVWICIFISDLVHFLADEYYRK